MLSSSAAAWAAPPHLPCQAPIYTIPASIPPRRPRKLTIGTQSPHVDQQTEGGGPLVSTLLPVSFRGSPYVGPVTFISERQNQSVKVALPSGLRYPCKSQMSSPVLKFCSTNSPFPITPPASPALALTFHVTNISSRVYMVGIRSGLPEAILQVDPCQVQRSIINTL